MLAKRGLRERPTYESLMQTLREDYPLQLPNRDAYFLRNSIQMMQFDGLGMLDNLEEQSNKIDENILRAAVLKDVASGRGTDAKLIQTDPTATAMADKFTQAIINKLSGGSQTDTIETRTSGSSMDKKATANSSTDPIAGTRSSGSSTDKRTTANSGNNPMFNTAESSSQIVPSEFDIAGVPLPMESHETQTEQIIEEPKSLSRRKQGKKLQVM